MSRPRRTSSAVGVFPGWQWEKPAARFLPRKREEFALEVLRVIAQSLRHRVPLLPALHGLEKSAGFAGLSLREVKAGETLRLFIADIEDGVSLGEALIRHYGDALPPYASEALPRAEASGRLPILLPVLFALLSGKDDAMTRCRSAFFVPLMQLLGILAVLSGLCIFIVPKFLLIIEELSTDFPLAAPLPFRVLENLSRLGAFFPLLFVVLRGIFGLVRLLRLGPGGRAALWALGQAIFRPVPLAGTMIRRLEAIECHGAMAALVTAGLDIPAAAEACAGLVQSRRMRQALLRFARETQAGAPWLEVWERTFRPEPLSLFLLRNAATREQPDRGFAAAATWLSRDLRHRVVVFTAWAEPVGILLNALLVGVFVYAIAGALFSTLYETMMVL